MPNMFFPMFLISGSYNDPEYYNLSKEEKENLQFVDKCLFSEDKRISDASFHMMMLLLEIKEEIDKYDPEEIQERKDSICKDLTEEETIMMDKFLLACINTMGIYSEESKQERKLTREKKGKINNE